MKVDDIIKQTKSEGRSLFEPEAYRILEKYDIPVPKWGMASTDDELHERCESVGYPAVIKVISPQIVHKSDANALILNLNSYEEVKAAYIELMRGMDEIDPNLDIRGVLVSEMMPVGREVIIGMTRDPQFGPAVLIGLGGIFVEVLNDVAYRVTPVTEKDARQMIEAINGYPLLKGVRNLEPSDIDTLVDIIQKVSMLADDEPDIAELDLNPVLVYGKGACAVDARIILKPDQR